MKNFTLLSVFTLMTIFAQAENCYRSASFIGAEDVDVTGTVTLEVQTDGSIQLKLSSDFLSESGPDLDIYLGSTDRVDGFSLRIEPLTSLTGAQTYMLPSSIKLDDYEYVTIHCTQYNHHYGAAKLASKQGDCSSLKTTNSVIPNGFNFNIKSSSVIIDSDKSYENVSLMVYDIAGVLQRSEFVEYLNKGRSQYSWAVPKSGILIVSGKELFFQHKYILN
jgi:hypothetical protein